ncbi:hypothetical protein [Sphaerisporangium perillae]|uniref:hypothetical protein n=1 Tax=Sphaerisporangium perillae TaxID=2935860 RepID=UPI00200C6CD6|nr:hypothetical protein [Sphaerisporangium perillae]
MLAGVEERGELNDLDLPAAMAGLRGRLAAGETPAVTTAEALALAREAARRAEIGAVQPVHIVAAAVLCNGWVGDTKDSEDRSIAAALAACVYALQWPDVHMVTRHQSTAQDHERFAAMYDRLGLRTALITQGSPHEERGYAYAADVLYSDVYELCNDYVRDNIAWDLDECVQAGHGVAILDKIDDILVQQGRSPAIVSGRSSEADRRRWFCERVQSLRPGEHFEISERRAHLTPLGLDRLDMDDALTASTLVRRRMAEEALTAAHCFHLNRDYTIRDGAVFGKVPQGVRHALEAKEEIEIGDERQTLGEILPWDYYRGYEILVGLSPTARLTAPILDELAGATVVTIPQHGSPLPALVRPEQAKDSGMERALRQQVADMLEFTDVQRGHRKGVYSLRRAMLECQDPGGWVRSTLESVVEHYVAAGYRDSRMLRWTLDRLYSTRLTEADLTGQKETVLGLVLADARTAYERRWRELGDELAPELARRVVVSVTDRVWREHLIALDYLPQVVDADSPRVFRDRYHQQATHLYDATIYRISEESIGYLFHLDVDGL